MENHWPEIERVLGEILELPDVEARKYLERTHLSDEVRLRVGELFRASRESDGFLERPPLLPPSAPDRLVGQRLGPWRIVSVIGSGGMGTVYRATRDDGDFAQEAALKVIAAGRMTSSTERRFRDERRILARLEHPFVARLIDGGMAPDGSPYLAMEYVEGVPVTEWCRREPVGRRGSLRLFLQICEAVQYAHQNLVVHCDLKPANILVTRQGTPKLLDFGVARLLAHETGDPITTVLHPMTPDYASPEQVRGEAPGTVSDVYSLGILLFELLTGHRPYQLSGKTLDEVVAAICGEEIEKPGTGAGDLDAIIRKAVRKDPQRRYGSVEQLASDVQRYLDGRPISARPDSLFYRARKFVVRRPVPVSAVALVLIAVIAGTLATLAQSRRAERRFNEVRSLAHAVLYDVYDAIGTQPGTLPARRLVASRAQQYLDTLSRDAAGDPALIRDLAESYLRLGDVRGSPYLGNLGDTAGALESFQKGQALLDREIAQHPADPGLREVLFQIHFRLGRVLEREGKLELATAVLQKTVAEAELRFRLKRDLAPAQDLSRAYAYLAETQDLIAKRDHEVSMGRLSIETSRKALSVLEAIGPRPDESWLEAHAARNQRIGYALWLLGDQTGDRSYYRQAADCFTLCYQFNLQKAAAHGDHSNDRGIADDLNSIGSMRWKCCADLHGAIRDMRQALATFQRLAQEDPNNLEAVRDLGNSWNEISVVYSEAGRRQEALDSDRKAVALYEQLGRADPSSAENAAQLAAARARLAALEARTSKSTR